MFIIHLLGFQPQSYSHLLILTLPRRPFAITHHLKYQSSATQPTPRTSPLEFPPLTLHTNSPLGRGLQKKRHCILQKLRGSPLSYYNLLYRLLAFLQPQLQLRQLMNAGGAARHLMTRTPALSHPWIAAATPLLRDSGPKTSPLVMQEQNNGISHFRVRVKSR